MRMTKSIRSHAMTLTIRDATTADEAGWRDLWAQYLAFYRVELAPDVTDATWARLMDPASPMAVRLAEQDGRLAGFAIHLPHPSTWVKDLDCYLEDLYLDPGFRGQGIGRALIDDLIGLCQKNGWARLYWHTDEGNATARKLYDSYVKSDGHVRYRMRIAS
jgi:GNAT superfamily N-acetyltransferase